MIRLRVNEELCDGRFIVLLLNSLIGRAMVDQISVESTRTRVSLGEYKQLRIVLPPIEEQASIAAALNEFVMALDQLAIEAARGVTFLHERRSALVSAAVTGKIDVRHYQTEAA